MEWIYLCYILFSDLNRLIHKNFSHPHLSSGTSTRSFSGELNKCTEHFATQKGGIQHFHPVNRHRRVSSNLTLLQLNIKSVSLMLEDKWSGKSSKRDNQTSTLLSMELKSPLSYFCTNSFKADFPLQAKNVHRNVGHMNPNTNLVLWAVFHWQWTVFILISSLVKSTWALRTSTFSSVGKRNFVNNKVKLKYLTTIQRSGGE